jgi:tRNA dimethylallyltransferase
MKDHNSIALLGPTACGKTALAAQIALALNCEIISADSRQVYRRLDIGSGKDVSAYTVHGERVPYHVIDVADLSTEYSVFDFQRDAYKVFAEIIARKKIPLIAGGTGMYLDCLIRGYDFVEVPANPALRENLCQKSTEELAKTLSRIKGGKTHNSTDTTERARLIRAIEIQTYTQSDEGRAAKKSAARPVIQPLVLGLFFPRGLLKKRITERLSARFKQGMIEEVRDLYETGTPWERLERLGLEYKYIALFLQKKIATQSELFAMLNTQIARFAKRQETWFRGMEKKGVVIHRIDGEKNNCFHDAMAIIERSSS